MHMPLPSEAETLSFGMDLGRTLRRRCTNSPVWTLTLSGDLGSGKTTLVGAILSGMGHSGPVPSPTYTLMQPYELDSAHCWHLDLYRLRQQQGAGADLQALGLDEVLNSERDTLLLVEWPERAADALPPADLALELAHSADGGRSLQLSSGTARGAALLRQLPC